MSSEKEDLSQPQKRLSDTDLASALSAGIDESTAFVSDKNIGRELNSYRIEFKLGEGGMGKVYLARHKLIGKKACVKISDAGASDSFSERFLREAKILANLDHPNLITAFDFGQFDGGQYILMPYIKGVSLSDLLKRNRKLTLEECIEIILQAAKGLSAAHEQGVIHRDVKPGNLLIDSDGKVWVSDFGISLFNHGEESSFMTRTGETLGSPSYIAPEQIEGQSIDHRVDIYALGATFYHLLFETPPFKADTPILVLKKHLDEVLTFPNAQLDGVPKVIVECIKKMLAKNPDHRYQSMNELCADLESFMTSGDSMSISSSSVRLSEETLQQIIYRCEDIKKREEAAHNKLTLNELHEIGSELNIPKDRIELARQEIEEEKRNGEQASLNTTSSLNKKIEILDKMWLYMAISVLALSIPVFDIYICSYISLFLTWKYCEKLDETVYRHFSEAGTYSKYAFIILIIALPLNLLSLLDRDFREFEIMIDPLSMIGGVLGYVVLWKIFNGLLDFIENRDKTLMKKLESVRIKYIIYTIIMAFMIGIFAAIIGRTSDASIGILMILTLPFFWFLGWRYILAPIKEVKYFLIDQKN